MVAVAPSVGRSLISCIMIFRAAYFWKFNAIADFRKDQMTLDNYSR